MLTPGAPSGPAKAPALPTPLVTQVYAPLCLFVSLRCIVSRRLQRKKHLRGRYDSSRQTYVYTVHGGLDSGVGGAAVLGKGFLNFANRGGTAGSERVHDVEFEFGKRLIDDLLSLFGGRPQPVMASFVETGKLTADDVKEAERTLRKLARKEKSK